MKSRVLPVGLIVLFIVAPGAVSAMQLGIQSGEPVIPEPPIVITPQSHWFDYDFNQVFENQKLIDLNWISQSAKTTNPLLRIQGAFWRNAQMVTNLGLSSEQQQRMDEIFRAHRINLIDLNAAVEKEELILEPLVEALPAGDQARIAAQIDKVASARAELEKANAKMLVNILQVMTPEQVGKLPGRNHPFLIKPAPSRF